MTLPVSQPAPSHCVLTWWKVLVNSQSLLYKALIPFMSAPPVWPKHFPKTHLLKQLVGVRISTYEFRDTQTCRIEHSDEIADVSKDRDEFLK